MCVCTVSFAWAQDANVDGMDVSPMESTPSLEPAPLLPENAKPEISPELKNEPPAEVAPESSHIEAENPPPVTVDPKEHSEDKPKDPAREEQMEAILANPTRSVEEYEAARKELLYKQSVPNWAFNITISPRAFRDTNFRVIPGGVNIGSTQPKLIGVLLSGERIFFKSAGLASIGIEVGTYRSGKKDNFEKLGFDSFLVGGPYAQYEAVFLRRQWVVPVARAGYEFLRYNYEFLGNKNRGVSQIMRFDIGLLFFLNMLEPSSSGQLLGNYGIKRTYLAATYTIANDRTSGGPDFGDKSFRVGVRFEY